MKNEYKCICVKCGKEYTVICTETQFKNNKFRKTCSSSCANSHEMTDERRQKISKGVLRYNKEKDKKEYVYICECCGKEFITDKRFKVNRKIHCPECIQNRKHFNDDPKSILDLSKRTISKILHRANKGCAICGWNESTCDIHHIIERKNGGKDNIDNLIIVCPNCHRIIHNNKKYSIEYLQNLSIDKNFSNWKDFYYPSN